MPGCTGSFYDIKRIFEERERVDLDLNESADIIKRIAENKTGPLQRSEQVAKQREMTADRIFKKQRRPARLIHASLQRADFQPGVKRYINVNQLFVPFKIDNTFLQIFVAHIIDNHPEKMS